MYSTVAPSFFFGWTCFVLFKLWYENTSESDPRNYEATKAVAKKAQKKSWGFNGIWTHNLHDTAAMLYQLSYEACWG